MEGGASLGGKGLKAWVKDRSIGGASPRVGGPLGQGSWPFLAGLAEVLLLNEKQWGRSFPRWLRFFF